MRLKIEDDNYKIEALLNEIEFSLNNADMFDNKNMFVTVDEDGTCKVFNKIPIVKMGYPEWVIRDGTSQEIGNIGIVKDWYTTQTIFIHLAIV